MRLSVRLRKIASDPRIRVPLVSFLIIMILLSIERTAILATSWLLFSNLAWSQLLTSFVVGLRFDTVVSCMLVVAVWLPMLLAPRSILQKSLFKSLTALYVAVILTLVVTLCLADFFFFQEFEERLNLKAITYAGAGYVYQSIWENFPIIPVLLVIAGSFCGFYRLLKVKRVSGRFQRSSQLRGIIFMLGAAPFLFLGIRNSLDNKSINAGPAYFSNSTILAQLTLNGLFTLREAALSATSRHVELSTFYQLLPEEKAIETAVSLLRAPGDQFLADERNPLRRVTDTGKPQSEYNVVLVLLESMSWHYIEEMGGRKDYMPNMNKLIREGLLMERCFAVGTRTTRGLAGILCGFPDLPGRGVTTRIETEGNFLTLANVLGARGYQTIFVNGADALEDHHLAFLRSNGYNHLLFEDDFERRTFGTKLGWCDEDMYNQALDEFAAHYSAHPDQPFLGTMLTVSFHQPFLIPEGRVTPLDPKSKNANEIACIQYTDWAIGQFIEKAKQAPYYDKTIFVFVADHMGGFLQKPITAASFRVPFLIYAPEILAERKGERISTVCSQTDIAPTIMALLGGRYEHSFFGSSILDRPPERGMALMQKNETLYFMNGAGDIGVVQPNDPAPRLLGYAPPGSVEDRDETVPEIREKAFDLQRKAVALLQTAEILYERGVYNLNQAP